MSNEADEGVADPPATYERYVDHCDQRGEEARFTDWLRERAQPAWSRATDHRFTDQVRAGTVDDDVFARYLVQDYAFLSTLVGTFGHALGAAPTMAEKSRLADFLGTLTDEENDYFQRSFEALSVPEPVWTDPELTPTTRAFEDLLVRVGQEGYAEALAVLVPAEWVYLAWAKPAPDERPEQFYLDEWITLHAVEEFASFVGWLRAELDREGAAASERRQAHLAALFERAVDLEVAFFESAYEPGVGPDGSTDPAQGGEQSW